MIDRLAPWVQPLLYGLTCWARAASRWIDRRLAPPADLVERGRAVD